MAVPIRAEYRFDDAVILATGAGSGIGAALAGHCANHGAKVIAVDIEHGPLNAQVSSDDQRACIDVQCVDVGRADQVDCLFDKIEAQYGRLDAAVLGAAVQCRVDIADMSPHQWQHAIDVNLNGVFHCLRRAIPMFKRQRSGAIVTFTSGLALTGWPGAGAYAASKAALIGMTKSVAYELKDHNVRANVLSPGVIATPIFINVASEKEKRMYEEHIGIGAPEDVIPTLLYLISDASINLTGVVIEHRIRPS